ncbi:MAG: TetR/AcrR family transcriptional regulator, partial [Notoacmeibacter sp.]
MNNEQKVPTQDKILNAALKLVRQKGFGATRIDDICAEAGVTKGAFFHHFKDKEAMG